MNINIPSQEEFITTYGEEDRTTVIMEELSELIKAVSKYKRYILNKEKYTNDKRYSGVSNSVILENLKEEMADTLICIRIMQDITGITDSEIEEKVEEKHERNLLLCKGVQS